MSNIDYSQYYVRFSSNGNKTNKVKSIEAPAKPQTPPKHRKGGGALFSISMVLICFALTFLLAGILNKDGVQSLFQPANEYFAYVLVSHVPESGETGLNELSKFVRAGGGAGNILLKEGKYYVVHSVYMNKKDAQTVQSRDKNSEIFGLKEKPFKTDVDSLKVYQESYNTLKCELIRALYDAIIVNAKTEDNDGSIKEILKMRNPFAELKEKLMKDKNLNANDTLQIIVAIDTICGRLEGLTTASATRISLVSDMRYQLYAICTNI